MKVAILFFTLIGLAGAQAPTGTIAGVVRDPSGAAVGGARIEVVSLATGLSRTTASSEEGDYSLPALLAGEYEVSVQAPGFQRTVRKASVEAGATTTTELQLRIGDVSESVTVEAASPQLHYDSHSVGGLITRSQIDSLPLNGRSFLDLAKLEPGVQPTARLAANRTLVPVLGSPGGTSGRGTRVTIDGGSVMALTTGGSFLGLSQEGVQEAQISTVNFDLSTGLTFSGAVNAVTRSGGNDVHGSAFYFFRDHNLAAYPILNRNPANPEPFFQRRHFGFAAGGPIRRDRVFFFGTWERTEQRGVADTNIAGPDFAHLSGVTPSPFFGNQLSFRLDGRLSGAHTAFLRFSHDGNRAFSGPANAYPSNWIRQVAWADQSMLGLTSVFGPTLVNDLRFSYFFLSTDVVPPTEQDCPRCLGIGAPTISIPQAGLTIGVSFTSENLGRRFHLNDSLTWQRGTHRARFGIDWEHNRGGMLTWNNEPVTMVLWSPTLVRSYNAAPATPENLRIPLPEAFVTLNDVLRLPLQSFNMGIGDPRIPQENGSTTRTWNTARLFFHDTWRVHQRLTMNYGLAWSIDRNRNYDLSKPAFLAPILGADGLGPTRKQWTNFSPTLGLAWAPSDDGKTVIRAGAGIFYDFLFPQNLDNERTLLGPPGLGRQQSIPGSSIPNPVSGISGVPVGTPLNFMVAPTLFTGANLMTILPATRADQERSLAYTGDPSVRAIHITKQGVTGLFPADVPTWSAQHFNFGVQHGITQDFVLSAEFVYRHFIHGGLGPNGVDLNHYNSIRGSVIPRCSAFPAAQRNDPQTLCSNGPINVWQGASNQTQKGLLLRADKRFSHGFQLLGSHAYSSITGTAGTAGGPGFNLDNWFQNPGPLSQDYTHITNVSGVVQLPWRFEVGLNFSYSNIPPFSAMVGSATGGIDFNGDGTFGDLLPGTTVNQFNRGLGRSDLARLVSEFNETYAGTRDPQGRAIPLLTLPASYSLGSNFHSLDLRLSRSLALRENWRLSLIGEVFNLYNKANLTGYSGDLTNAAFGQPTNRLSQVFGSGGPRAFQLATRVVF